MNKAGSGLVLITGAASGIGRACAAAFDDAPRLLVDRDADGLAAVARPGDVTLACDLADPATTGTIVEMLQAGGGFAAGVHAAAISPTMGDAETILRLDYLASVRLAEQLSETALPGACLVLIASLAGHRPQNPDWVARLDAARDAALLRDLAEEMDSGAAYALAKHGVIRLAERTAARWGRRGARIVSLSPGLVDTAMQAVEAAASDAIAQLLAIAPIPRLGRAEEIAAVAAFLCSPGAGFVTGTDLRVDGGAVAALHQMATKPPA